MYDINVWLWVISGVNWVVNCIYNKWNIYVLTKIFFSDLDCTLYLYDKSTVKAKFGGPDIDFCKLFLKELETKASKYPQVLMRTSDILRIEIPKGSCQKLIEDKQESNEIEMKEV